MIKPALLDQTFIVGIGNIYADESLYRAKLHPKRLTDSISKPKLRELHSHIQEILLHAIRLMGTSVDTFAGINGQPGRYQQYLRAYSREGEPCLRCGRSIRREKIGSRSAHYCPRCQKLRQATP
jgi:formamidopyrimidine-DNA glycosylase